MTGEYEQSDDYEIVFPNEADAAYRIDDRRPTSSLIESLDGITPLQNPRRELSWHPFRMYALNQITRWLGESTISIFPTLYQPRSLEHAVEMVKQKTIGGAGFERLQDSVDEWNGICELAISVEPIYLPRIDRRISRPLGLTLDDFYAEVDRLRSDVSVSIEESSEPKLVAIHEKLCEAATLADPNSSVHTLMRLGSKAFRDRLSGNLARAVTFKTMAELVRRFAEDRFGIELPEEDERGFGSRNWPESKRLFFGSHRLFDGRIVPKREFLRHFQFDANARTRWYVEGQTEFGAMKLAFGSNVAAAQTEIVNLRGRVTERNILSFAGSLRRDQDEGVVSFILVDNDRSENLRIIRNAAACGHFFGEFHICNPDFETWNFTAEELIQICLLEAELSPASTSLETIASRILNSMPETVSTGMSAIHSAIRTQLPGKWVPPKGIHWGKVLMKYALKNPQNDEGQDRPVIDAIKRSNLVKGSTYEVLRNSNSICLESGHLVPKTE